MSMTTFLNIALLIIGTAATLAAFGGKTWSEGPEPVLTRINLRGWISLICLGLALAIGSYKEVRTQREDMLKEQASNQKQTELKDQLLAANAKEEIANEKIEGLHKIDQLTQDLQRSTQQRLGETKATLNDVRGNLAKAEDELDRQGQVNLLTALADSDMRVKDIQFFIPFTEKGNEASTFHGALLPDFSSSVCRKDTEATVAFWQGNSGYELMEYPPDDDKDRHAYFEDSPPKADVLFHPTEMDDRVPIAMINGLLGQHSSNYQAFGIVVHVLDLNESAAHFLDPVDQLHDYPLSINAMTPYENFESNETDDPIALKRKKDESVVCDEEAKQYFELAFEKAYFGITLNSKQNLSIYFRLKALKPERHRGVWRLSFTTESRPLVFVNDEFGGLFNVAWPDNKEKSIK